MAGGAPRRRAERALIVSYNLNFSGRFRGNRYLPSPTPLRHAILYVAKHSNTWKMLSPLSPCKHDIKGVTLHLGLLQLVTAVTAFSRARCVR